MSNLNLERKKQRKCLYRLNPQKKAMNMQVKINGCIFGIQGRVDEMMIYLESEKNNMDKLEQAMQSEDFWVELADTSFGTVVLHGKNVNSTANNEYYEVSSEINTDGDFAITFFKTYEKMKKWFDEWQGEGFYNYLTELYEKQLV